MLTFEGKSLDQVADDVDAMLTRTGSDWRVGHWVDVTGALTADIQLNKVRGDYRPSEMVTARLTDAGIMIEDAWINEPPC